ncbi:MAG: DUF2085 domain-containing protein [Acidobacteriota bacterium]|nr:DUF2085 domain-containing protein [Acidobacteriota bacterium]
MKMPQTIENYVPQAFVRQRKRQAFFAWGLVFLIALVWIGLIVSAPLAKASDLTGFSGALYTFFSYLCHQIPERSFHTLGFPLAVCSRCFGFYFGFLLGLGAYPFFRALDDVEPFARFWLFLAIVPMGIDWSLTFFGIWENTHLSRSLTGAILGFACAFFIVPALAEISRFFVDRKLKRLSW